MSDYLKLRFEGLDFGQDLDPPQPAEEERPPIAVCGHSTIDKASGRCLACDIPVRPGTREKIIWRDQTFVSAPLVPKEDRIRAQLNDYCDSLSERYEYVRWTAKINEDGWWLTGETAFCASTRQIPLTRASKIGSREAVFEAAAAIVDALSRAEVDTF